MYFDTQQGLHVRLPRNPKVLEAMKRKQISINTPRKKARYATPEALALRQANQSVAVQRKTAARVEMKVTHLNDAQTVSNTGYIQSLTANMTRGNAAVDNYLGNEVLPTSVRVNIGLTMGPSLVANGDGTNFLRVIVFQWYDSTSPAVSGILNTSSSPFSMLNWVNIENIKVLADRLVNLHQYGLKQDSYDSWSEKIYIKGKKMVPVKFNVAGTAAQKGDIYLLVVSDSSVPANPYMTYQSQITYTDS